MMNISKLSEFTSLDTQRTILHLVWQARECLSDAERKKEIDLEMRAGWCRQAVSLLDTARRMLEYGYTTENDHANGLSLLECAHSAATAAFHNGQIAVDYDDRLTGRIVPSTDREREHAPKTISIFKRAAETARQETHRALTELCELFPDAMPTEEP
jgi:hypothetical protein